MSGGKGLKQTSLLLASSARMMTLVYVQDSHASAGTDYILKPRDLNAMNRIPGECGFAMIPPRQRRGHTALHNMAIPEAAGGPGHYVAMAWTASHDSRYFTFPAKLVLDVTTIALSAAHPCRASFAPAMAASSISAASALYPNINCSFQIIYRSISCILSILPSRDGTGRPARKIPQWGTIRGQFPAGGATAMSALPQGSIVQGIPPAPTK